MAYIGNQPFTAAFLTDTFSGNGSTVAFTMTVAPANTSSILVAVTGVLQDPSTYSVSGTTLTFSAAPPSGTSNISVRYLGIPASGVATTAYRTVTEFTATASQTTFSVPSYTVGYVDVYRNGVMLGSADYTATSGTTIVLASGATAGDLVEVISFYVSSVLNAIPATAGSVGTTYLADSAVTVAKVSATGTPSSSTYLRGDGAWATVTSLPGTQGQVFTASGTFTIPTGITAIKVTVVGGGAAGGSASGNYGGGGGGAGGAAIKYLTGLTPGNTLTVTRGAAAGTSSVASGTQTISTISATGGSAGSGGALAGASGGNGGTGSGGDIDMAGGGGGVGGNGIRGGGTGGCSIFGAGGASKAGAAGGAGGNFGGGGAGGGWIDSVASYAGGAGAGGVVIFEW